MRVDFVAFAAHYIDHLAPIYRALPGNERGNFYTTRALRGHATQRGIFAVGHGSRARLAAKLKETRGLVVTAGYADLSLVNATGRPQIYFNHGAGFRYTGDFAGYCGSTARRELVSMFLAPSSTAAEWERRACPWATAVAVGCPKLDVWHERARDGWVKRRGERPRVAISFHHDAGPVPEMRSAFPYYRARLSELAREFDLVGHGHPKWGAALSRIFAEAAIRWEPSFDRILETADLYVCDTSSTIYEFASTDRPVVLLNAPWYRRWWSHPGNPRFWSHADVGLQCDEPAKLSGVVRVALEDAEEVRARRRAAVAAVYAVTDGTAASLAAAAIVELSRELGRIRTAATHCPRMPAPMPAASPGPALTASRIARAARREQPHFGIIITARNRSAGLEGCLASIAAQSRPPDWVVLSDLGSDAETRCTLSWQARRFGISYLRIDYAGRWNKGLAFNTALRRMPSCEFVIQLDMDMIAAPDLLEHCAGVLVAHRAVAYIPRFAPRASTAWSVGRAFDEILRYTQPSQSAWAIGSCMVLPSEWLFEQRGIDEAYTGWGMEDSDVWWRATTDLPGHVEQTECRVIHQWHPHGSRSREVFLRNKERFYRRLLGEAIETNSRGWGGGTVAELELRTGIRSPVAGNPPLGGPPVTRSSTALARGPG